ncbi:hypothetical protein ASPZODRAFT_133152 [Penicilliopsis zonata CBS 506.65]|uniref:D-isomer specific 2-hydroxyacid dehydrogenase NAD-binding domain-containing protein n=1 Tax=Penicilliopsis zonata CBS 506.65 TaxID=1073090 RepID=A0A1L9SGA8_9EURO|nr:hypothetical protein ASPZODRAFT_133152 [Penicilliopsis zonata CBS 506.65]OJJ46153.1 hypothetical protein ASPZODRAFT_133152 [Penicilliopsis zonata CBS 506.65]
MGEAVLPREHLLVIYYHNVPESLPGYLEHIFPDTQITIYRSERDVPVPKELYRQATILATFFHVPDPEDAKNLKLVHTTSAGIDHLQHLPLLRDTQIPISTSSGLHGPPIAEWTIMNWLITSRGFLKTQQAQKDHIWDRNTPGYLNSLYDQVGKRVGILGYGSIGRQIARIAVAMGMTVHAYTASPRLTPESRRDTGYIVPGTGDPDGSLPVSWHHGSDKESLHKFISLGLDHLVVALPLTPQTTRLLGKEEFALLAQFNSSTTASLAPTANSKAKPFLTNISRGRVLDQDALIEALQDGTLGGAALDVTDPEPLPADSKLWDAPNLTISPHTSSLGVEYFRRAMDILALNAQRLRKGEPLINGYNRQRGY